MLDKQSSDNERIEKLNQQKELRINRQTNILQKEMLEKEKFYEIIAEAAKTPNYKKVKQKISELEIMIGD